MTTTAGARTFGWKTLALLALVAGACGLSGPGGSPAFSTSPPSDTPWPSMAPSPATPSPSSAASTIPSDLSAAEVSTRNALTLVDGHPLYRTRYSGPYKSPAAALAPGSTADLDIGWACSLLAALADPDSRVYGRNFV
jgi:hypothetical protein